MDITPVQVIPDQIDLRITMRDTMLQLRTTYGNPYLVMLFESKNISRPTFALVSPGSNFHIATVRAHILDPLNPQSNYFNDCQVKIPVDGLCQLNNHNCAKKHTQLIRFDRICQICLFTTPAGNIQNAMKLVKNLCQPTYWVYDFKDTYAYMIEDYKKTRVQVFGNYEYTAVVA